MESRLSVSVIVPVYNVRQHLEQCVDSILTQSYPVVEVLLVDDGSTDGSGDLCDCLANEHVAVRVIHKENAGLGFARNTGLDNVSPEATHIMFVDSDDWLEPGMMETFAQTMERYNADCVLGGFTKRDDMGKALFESKMEDATWQNDTLVRYLVPRVCGSAPGVSDSIPMSVCSSLFAKKIIDEHALRFPSEREVISEDFVFKFRYLKACGRVATTSCTGYSYRTNPLSLSMSYRPDRFEASLRFYKYASQIVAGFPAEEECLLRLKKTLFIYIRMCISQERSNISGKRAGNAAMVIATICHDNRLLQVIESYPVKSMGWKQRTFIRCIRGGYFRTLCFCANLGLLD